MHPGLKKEEEIKKKRPRERKRKERSLGTVARGGYGGKGEIIIEKKKKHQKGGAPGSPWVAGSRGVRRGQS